MAKINDVKMTTANRFLNMFEVDATDKNGRPARYDGVIIYSLYGEKRDRVVLIRQYRYPVDGYVYEFPAGLVDAGENYEQAAVREMHEETGLVFTPLETDPMYQEPRFTTVGLTDESCATVYGYSTGSVSGKYLEASEEIEVVLADREEVRRILKEERVAIMCAYQLMHFLADEEPFRFLQAGEEV